MTQQRGPTGSDAFRTHSQGLRFPRFPHPIGSSVCLPQIAGSVTTMEPGHGWDDTVAEVRTLSVAFVGPVTELMTRLAPEWSDRVIAKRILLNYPPGIGVGFRARADEREDRSPEVDLSWAEDVYDIRLLNSGRLLVTADECTDELAGEVLASFLLQLPGP